MKTILLKGKWKVKAFRLCFLFLFFTLAAGAQTTFSNRDTIFISGTDPVPIPGKPYPSTIAVANQSGMISDLEVTLNGYVHDLPDAVDILLVAPDGTSAVILSDVGGAQDIHGINITLDDSAANALPDNVTFGSGTYRPTNMGFGPDSWAPPAPAASGQTALSTFYGLNPNGTWSLYVVSDSDGGFGLITGGWSLTFRTIRTSLSVKFSDFSATYNQAQNNVLLSWSTLYEFNTRSFVVERSSPGSAWSAVAEIPAAGFAYAGPAYQYNDQQVSDGNYLYRIRMVARDGSVKYSAVQFVRVDSGTNFLIYPNPARSYTNIRSQSMQPETIQVSLAGQNGTVFWQRQGSVSKFAPLRLDLDGIPPGDYIIIIMTSSRRQSETLRILN